MKKFLESLGDKVEHFSRYTQEIADSYGTPRISGLFILDIILKQLCSWVFGAMMITGFIGVVSFIMTLTTIFGVTYSVGTTLFILILSIPIYLVLTYLSICGYEYSMEKYGEYKENYHKNRKKYYE
jgi:hypothetical protein